MCWWWAWKSLLKRTKKVPRTVLKSKDFRLKCPNKVPTSHPLQVSCQNLTFNPISKLQNNNPTSQRKALSLIVSTLNKWATNQNFQRFQLLQLPLSKPILRKIKSPTTNRCRITCSKAIFCQVNSRWCNQTYNKCWCRTKNLYRLCSNKITISWIRLQLHNKFPWQNNQPQDRFRKISL